MIKIGITSIDEDHEKIIKVLDHCLSILVDDSLDNFEKANFVTLSLGEIGRHITQHFAEEEKYMKSVDHKHTDHHIKIHKQFLTLYVEFLKESRTLTYSTYTEFVTDFVKDFKIKILEHIETEDSKLPVLESKTL